MSFMICDGTSYKINLELKASFVNSIKKSRRKKKELWEEIEKYLHLLRFF